MIGSNEKLATTILLEVIMRTLNFKINPDKHQ
jgi:hypothetical protein